MKGVSAALRVVVIAAAVAVAGARPARAAVVAAGAPFALRVGGEAEITGSGVIVRFTAVAEDSRCPINALCIQAGVLRIVLTVSAGVRDTYDIEIDTMGGTAEAGGYVFRLVVAKPSRLAGVPLAPEDYGVLILVEALPPAP